MPLVAGVDSSTSACKVEVRDADTGELVASGRAPHPPTTPPRSEQDPRDVVGRVRGRLRRGRRARRQPPGGDRGRRPAARPRRARRRRRGAAPGQAVERHRVGARRRRAGRRARRRRRGRRRAAASRSPASPSPSSRWLRRCEPEVFGRIARVLLPHDWLTGAAHRRGSPPTAATRRAPGGGRRPRSATASTCSPSSTTRCRGTTMLPEVLGPTEPAGEWDGHRSSGPGTGDNMAAALGLGLRPGDLALSLGTSGTAFARQRPSRPPTPSGTVAGFADATGRFLPLVCTLNATKVTDAVARLLGVDAAGLDALALGRAGRRRRPRARAPPRRRAHPEPARRHRHAHRHPLRRRPASSSPGPRSRASSQPPRRRRPPRRPGAPTVGSCSSAAAPAAPPTARSSPTSPADRSSSPTPTSSSPAAPPSRPPRCSPARSFDDLADAWGLGPARDRRARPVRRRRRHPRRLHGCSHRARTHPEPVTSAGRNG